MSLIAGGYLEELTAFFLTVEMLTRMKNWIQMEGKEKIIQIFGRYDFVGLWCGSIRLVRWPAGGKLAIDL